PGWWDGLVGPGRPLDTDRMFIVCPNVLGGCQGTTGPASVAPDGRPWGSRWPDITIGDQVRVEAALADALGIATWAGVVGGSMGGMRALEWAVGYPDRVRTAVLLACGPVATAEQIALYSTHLAAIRLDPHWAGGDYHSAPAGRGPSAGLALAREIAQIGYRSERELASRFGATIRAQERPTGNPEHRYEVVSYLEHHGEKLVRRFDAGTYVTLTAAMMDQDIGRGRGGVAEALRTCPVPVAVGAVDSDRLYPPYLQRGMAELFGVELDVLSSLYGHDGFLLELDAVGAIVRRALGAVLGAPASSAP
ncbi:MAG: homoserine O-acetyltransferase MetX, partial [Frankia sp.]